MRDSLEEFIIVHPYSEEEYIQPKLRAFNCSLFSVLNIRELNNIKSITNNFNKLETLKFNPLYSDITFVPKAIFIQYEPIIKNIPERLVRSELYGKEIEIETKMSLFIPALNQVYEDNSFSLHDYSNLGASVLNNDNILYKEQITNELVFRGKYIKGSRYTLRFNYELFFNLCKYLNKSLIYA